MKAILTLDTSSDIEMAYIKKLNAQSDGCTNVIAH